MTTKAKKSHEPENLVKDQRFLRFCKQTVITHAEADPDITTGRAAALINELDDKDIEELCEASGLADEVNKPEAVHGTGDAAAPSGRLIDRIVNIDPEKIQKFINLALMFVGLFKGFANTGTRVPPQ